MSERLRILVLSSFNGMSANVIGDFLFSFRLHPQHQHYFVFNCEILDRHFDFRAFDVVLIFWSLYLLGPELSDEVRESIREAPACKVLFLQDEYRHVHRMNQLMAELGVNIMFTCVAERDHETFYPRARIPSLHATYSVLTGYVPTYLENGPPDLGAAREVDIGYRSREVPFYLGDLGRQKKLLAERFAAVARDYGFRSDISVRESDRLYGRQWVDFLRRSRFVLGSASGASVIDFTGEIRQNCERHLARHPQATYEELKAKYFADVDGKVVIDTVSPRIFEATALGCTLVQHEGAYAGILHPDEHYICVKRDYSNIGEVIDRMKDAAFCRRLAEHAYADLIASGRYTYRQFSRWFAERLAQHVPLRRRSSAVSPLVFYARNYLLRDQTIIPYRQQFVALPSLLQGWLLAALGRLPKRVSQPLEAFVRNPGSTVRKLRLLVVSGRTSPSLRAIWGCFRRDRRAGGGPSVADLARDLIRIDVVRRALAGTLKSPQALQLSVEYEQVSGVVTLMTAVRGGVALERGSDPEVDARAVSPLSPEVASALLAGTVSMVVWDHSAVSAYLAYGVNERSRRRSRWLTVTLGTDGVYRFEALMRLYRRAPTVIGPALVTLLTGR